MTLKGGEDDAPTTEAAPPKSNCCTSTCCEQEKGASPIDVPVVSKATCCSDTLPERTASTCVDKSESTCCSERVAVTSTSALKSACCSGTLPEETTAINVDEPESTCCSGTIPERVAVTSTEEPKSSCCSGAPPKKAAVTTADVPKSTCCSPAGCDGKKRLSEPTVLPRQCSTAEKKDGCCKPLPDRESRDVIVTIGKGGTEHWKQACFQVEGMTCTGCENTLNAALQGHPSIIDVKSNMFLNKAEVSYDPVVLSPADIIAIIQAAGFSARVQHSAAGNQACFLVQRRADHAEPEKEQSAVRTALDLKGIKTVDMTAHPQGFLVDVSFDPDITGTRDIALALRSQDFTVDLAKDDDDGAKKGLREMARMRRLLIISAVLVIPVVFLAFVFPHAGSDEIAPNLSARNLALFLLTTPIQLYVGAPIYRGAWNGIVLSRELNMDSLVVLSTSCAYFYSTIATIVAMVSTRYQALEVFFETSAVLVTLIILGRYLQALARGRAADALSKLRDLQSPSANLVVQNSKGEEVVEKIESGYLQRRDVIKILPSERIPADGVVVRGTADVDESNMTGESVPVGKGLSDEVMAGSINLNGTLIVRVTRVQNESKLNDITKLVEQAQATRAPSQALADKIATWFTPFVITLGLITYIVWLVLGLQGKVDTTKYPSGVLALTYAVAVLVVSCPCAIALAVPTVIVVGAGVAARSGILVKDGGVFEDAAKITHIVFDKTGTLTQGQFQVTDCLELGEASGGGEYSVYDLAAAAAASSEHPLSLAVASYCARKSPHSLQIDEATAYPGFGIACKWQGREVCVGKVAWVFDGVEPSSAATTFLTLAYQRGYSVVAVSLDQVPMMLFALVDGPRPEAAVAVNQLKAMGLQIHVISGDHQPAVDHIARQLRIDPAHAVGDCTPEDKLTRLTQLQTARHAVAFCGDGTNDAPVLAQAQLGVALGAGTSGVAIATANVVLLTNDLRGVVVTLDLARKVMARIRINFAWAFLYNLEAIPLAAGCFVPLMDGVRIPPALAGLGELVSVMPVLVVALLLKRYRTPSSVLS